MKTIQTILQINTSYPLMHPYNWEDIIFFDIETTGFSANTSFLYLIGCMYYKNNTWQMTQWLADDMNSETAILEVFFQMLKNYKRIVHFNGTGFDIPFILQKCRRHHLDYTFDILESFDIYKKILPFKKMLPLANYKLKTIEKFVGINRTDMFSGEDLIQIYANYLGRVQYEKLARKTPASISPKVSLTDIITHKDKDNTKNLSSEELSQIILLHNSEDVKGLIQVADLLYYGEVFNNPPLYEPLAPDLKMPDELTKSCITFQLTLPHILPQPVTLLTPFPKFTQNIENGEHAPLILRLSLTGNQMNITLPIYEGELKYFFENYREYFYLPKEDTAIHKSVAQYVDKEFKVKAKPATCYNKKYSRFLPQTGTQFSPWFKNSYQDKITYFELTNEALKEPLQVYEYINSLLQYIITNKTTKILQ
jgi:uncharacterized protein YprB with RNaseH-like and TPR domain